MNKILVAVVAGGYSGENEISRKSASTIIENIDKELFHPILVLWEKNNNKSCIRALIDGVEYPIDLNDFSFCFESQKVKFHYAYITIHGTPGEDGLLQGYLDMVGIPYNTGGVLCEALTFDKYMCNKYLSTYGAKVPKSSKITQNATYDEMGIINDLGIPLFVKPNCGGSSLATTKVTDQSQLSEAIKKAFEVAKEVIIEQYIPGVEVTCGCIILSNKIMHLPLTEVVVKNADFFDFEAKYKGKSEEITPARIPHSKSLEIQSCTKKYARLVGAKGIVRADYIITEEGTPYLLEINTTPGMTNESFIPQQLKVASLSLTDTLTYIIQDSFHA